MKWLHLSILIILFSNCQAQKERLLLEKELITDLTGTPIYRNLTEEVNGERTWKAEYRYLDSIEIYGITYRNDGLNIKGLMVKPKGEGKYPCIIFNRGGNREFGTLKIGHGATTLGQLANEGYVVVASQYRGNGGSDGKEEFGGKDVYDVLILTEVLGEITEADTSRIGMYGWSRGGMMTYIALTKTNRIKAAAVGGAVSDSHLLIEDRPEMEDLVFKELIPNYEQEKEMELDKRSAVRWAQEFPKNVPILIMHGNSDRRVRPEHSLRLALEFEKYRIPYRLLIFEGADHGISEHRDEVDEQVIDWFNRYLKENAPLPNMEYHGR